MSSLPSLPLSDPNLLETREVWIALATSAGLVRKQKIGRSNFYINDPLYELLRAVG